MEALGNSCSAVSALRPANTPLEALQSKHTRYTSLISQPWVWVSRSERRLLRHLKKCVPVHLPFRAPSSSAQTYRYTPLKHDRDIRLLHLDPGSDEDALSCSLRTVRLSKAPEYEAISYTWGDPIFSASIRYSRKGNLVITENLSAALYQFRCPDRRRMLWVDAVCINP